MTDYSWEQLNSREFEIIACNYAKDVFPIYSWILTQQTKDYNHDFEAVYNNFEKWGEAKHSKKPKKSMSRSQWDPTIASAKLINCVNEVLLVTSATIPLPYIVRSFHMIDSPLENVYFANRLLINEWNDHSPILKDFDLKYPVQNIKNKIKRKGVVIDSINNLSIYFFNQIEKNFLTPVNKVYIKSVYEINIASFVCDKHASILIPTHTFIGFTTNIYVYNLSFPDKCEEIKSDCERNIKIDLRQGYNIIKTNVVIKQDIKGSNIKHFKVRLNDREYIKTLNVCHTIKTNKESIINFEKEINKYISEKNSILNIEYLPLDKFNRYDKKYFYVRFDEREYYNYSKLCRIILHLATNIDFSTIDEKVLRKTIFKFDDYLMLEDFIVGVFDGLLAYDCMNNIDKVNYILNYLKSRQISHNCFYIIENVSFLKGHSLEVLKRIEANFVLHNNQNFIIYQKYDFSPKRQPCITDNLAIVLFIESGVLIQSICDNSEIQNNELVCKDIEKSITFPDYKADISIVLDYLCNKTSKDLMNFFNKLYGVISHQSWSNRALDAMLLINKRINKDLYLLALRNIRDIYYSKTDFWNAYGYSQIIKKLNYDSPIEIYIDDIYKEADELNHCGSITESREKFSLVVELIEKNNLESYTSKKLEAVTEIYNISFWLLDTKDLIKKIDKTIEEFYPEGLFPNTPIRDQYPYYNCINRKMVTEYLLELYNDAEETFKLCLKESKLNNYVAFAYMDSARGLYKEDVKTAYYRLNQAYDILNKLKESDCELRRFYDCSTEKSYLEFVLSDDLAREKAINNLLNKVYEIKKRGYKSMVKKSYFKLAACYLVLGNLQKAKTYLDLICNDKDYKNSPRNQIMYNSLNAAFFYLLNNQSGFYSLKNKKSVEFNCFENCKSSKLYIETRLW